MPLVYSNSDITAYTYKSNEKRRKTENEKNYMPYTLFNFLIYFAFSMYFGVVASQWVKERCGK
jgi:hypothetical protein